ncbi:porin [Vibrio albus]|uniref:Porin n=1 Tax=Vibrio albus TaxID=2200953 RepID=A0A2U3B5H8_9VIBR|nr:porin [Vibrio albus]PWI32046.1 porin [Vibrio albus]
MNIKPLAAAVSLLVAAGTVSAGEIYASDDNKVEIKGWAESTALSVKSDKVNKNLHVYTDAQLKVIGTHTLDEKSKVVGSYAINAGDSTAKEAKFADIKVEYDHADLGNFSVGDTGNSFGVVNKAKAGKGKNLYMVDQGGVDGQGLRYKKTINDLEFSANYETDSGVVEDGKDKHESNYAASLNYKTDDFSAAVAYGSDGGSARSIGLGGDYTVNELTLGAAFIRFEDATKLKVSDSVELDLQKAGLLPNEGNTYSVMAKYKLDDVELYGSVQFVDGEVDGKDVEAKTAYVGATYEVTSSLKTDLVFQTGSFETEADKEDGNFVKFVAKYSF